MEEKMVHVLLVSFPGQGHINPLLRLAKLIASKGLLVTFSTNEAIGRMMMSATGNSDTAPPMPVGKGYLRFEFFSDGFDSADDFDALLHKLETAGPLAIAALIRRQAEEGRPVSCIINNCFLPWVVDVAADLGLPSAVLWVQSCAVFSVYYHYLHSRHIFPASDDGWANFTAELPGLPALRSEDLPSFLTPSGPYQVLAKIILNQLENLSKASWVFVDSFDLLERPILGSTPARLAPVGPLFKSLDRVDPISVRGDMWPAASDCLRWLDACPPASVLYVSLGSVVVLPPEQVAEMARGLRDSGRRFLWVLKPPARSVETMLLLPEGFEEEVAGRGVVVKWCPQEKVLAHPAVAGFLTHCGWNSSVEALAAGVPVVALPQFGDQVTNAKFLVDVYNVGVRLREVSAMEVMLRIDELFVGAQAEEMRRNAMKWKDWAAEAVVDGGSSDRNIQAFVDEIRRGKVVSSGEILLPVQQDHKAKLDGPELLLPVQQSCST